MSLVFQTCHEELQLASSVNKTQALRHLCRLLRICLSLLSAAQHIHFTALSTINRMIDSCIISHVVHPWKYEESSSSAAAHLAQECAKSESNHNISIANKKNPVVRSGSNCGDGSNPSHVHAHLERIIQQSSPKAASRSSPRHRPSSWRSKPSGHQDSVRSLQSFVSSIQDDPSSSMCRDTSFIGQDGLDSSATSSAAPAVAAAAAANAQTTAADGGDYEKTPLEVLQNADPTQVLEILQESITKHKQLMGARHKCTPSVRLKSCTHHCVQILSARVFAVMCQGNNAQHRVINEGHIQTLVDALDPNHDPVSNSNEFLYNCSTLWCYNFQNRESSGLLVQCMWSQKYNGSDSTGLIENFCRVESHCFINAVLCLSQLMYVACHKRSFSTVIMLL
jgi:hypothetical protein